jgi:hypothetical protein
MPTGDEKVSYAAYLAGMQCKMLRAKG